MKFHRVDDVCRIRCGHKNWQRLRCFEEELAPQPVALTQEGVIPPTADGIARAFQRGLGDQPVRLLDIDQPRRRHQVPCVAAGPCGKREAVIDVILVAQARTRPHAIHWLVRCTHAIDRRPGEFGIARRVYPGEQRVRKRADVGSPVRTVRFD